MNTLKPHIVILGAGFGGTYVGKNLRRLSQNGEIEVTIVNETNYFLFTPLLHEVATGALNVTAAAEPIREIFHNSNFRISEADIERIDLKEKKVSINALGIRHTIPYDYLVIATGAKTNYYNIPGADRFTLSLKTLADATAIRDKIISSFEKAIFIDDEKERKKALSYIVIGGGSTGVELVSEIKELVHEMIDRYFNDNNKDHCLIRKEDVSISIIHGQDELLKQFPPKLRLSAKMRLVSQGIDVCLGSKVKSVAPDYVLLEDEKRIYGETIIWTAGVKPNVPEFEGEKPELCADRILIDEYQLVKGQDRVYALGDVACEEKPLPLLAQVAVNQAKTVSTNIIRSIRGQKPKSFRFHMKGSLVSLGQWFAIGDIYNFNIHGKITWWIWRTVYLFKFASWKKRWRIMFSWTMNMFYPRDTTNVLR